MPPKSNTDSGHRLTWRWFLGEVFGVVRQFGNAAIWAFVTCFLIYEVAHAFQSFAGRVSIADLVFTIAAHVNLTIAASLALSGLTTALWVNEYRRHRNTRRRLTQRTTDLEKRIDSQRESSLLTPEGLTREGDQ